MVTKAGQDIQGTQTSQGMITSGFRDVGYSIADWERGATCVWDGLLMVLLCLPTVSLCGPGSADTGYTPEAALGSRMPAAGMAHAQLLGQVGWTSSLQKATPSSRHR